MRLKPVLLASLFIFPLNTAMAGPAEEAINQLSGEVEEIMSRPLSEVTCFTETACNGFVKNEQFQVVWPENGWLRIDYYPCSGNDHREACMALLSLASELNDEDIRVGISEGLEAAASQGMHMIELGEAEMEFSLTSSGKPQCSLASPSLG